MIRIATEEDFNAILDHCEVFWKHTQFIEPFERDHTAQSVYMALNHGLLAVLEIDSKIVGFAAGVKSYLLGSTHALTGTELAWWIEPNYRGGHGIALKNFLEGLARDQGIKYWNMVAMESSMPAKIKAIYEKQGYELAETVYTKVL